MKKNDRLSRIARSVVIGLATGAAILPIANVTQAQTLSEYKAELAEKYPAYQAALAKEAADASAGARAQGEIVEVTTKDGSKHVDLDSNSQYKELRAVGSGWLPITVKDGAVVKPMIVRAVYGPGVEVDEGGFVNIGVGNVEWGENINIKDNADSVADMTNVEFRAEAGDIIFTNGVTKVKAENLYGGSIEGNYSYGNIWIGDGIDKEAENTHAVVKLVGNTKFNTDGWISADGKTVSGGKYITLSENGTLEANSAQIFNKGLGTEGNNTDPGAIRDDANQAIQFKAGKLLLDDERYNDEYLHQANTKIKAADGGKTDVVVKDTANNVAVARDIADVRDNDYAAGVATTKTNVVIGVGGDSAVNKLNATYLNMAATSDGSANTITLKDGRTLALGSDAVNRELVMADNAKPAQNVKVDVQGGSKLALGRFAVENRLSGDVNLAGAGSELAVEGGHLTVGTINANAGTKISVANGTALSTEKGITLTGAAMQVNGTVVNTDIVGDKDSLIQIGNDDKAGKMFISNNNSVSLTGTKVFLDPVWKDGATISDASQFAAEDSSSVDYLLTVGRNSLASLGTADMAKAISAFGATDLKWGENDIAAALYLATPVTLGTNGGIKVDGKAISAGTDFAEAGTAEFAANSLLMVDASAISGSAALTGNTLKVADGAKLYLDNVASNGTYTIANFVDTSAAKGWFTNSGDIITGKLFNATLNADSTVTVLRKNLQDSLPGAVLPNIINSMTFTEQEQANSPASRYIDTVTNGLLSDSKAVQLINVAAQPAEVAGATATAVEHSLNFAQQAQEHLSLLNPSAVQENQAWVKYTHRNGSVDGLDIGGMSTSYDNNFNGVTVGFDLPTVDSLHHGFAFSYGKGTNSGSLENDDFNTKGISWYGSLSKDKSNMLFDVGYYHTKHDVNGIWQASPITDVFTMGVTSEWKLPQDKDGHNAFVPHIGLRYSHVGTPSYSGYLNGMEAYKYHPEGKNFVSLPFGIGYVSESKTGAWTTSFYADVAYVPVLGGRSADMRVQACGINAEDVFAYDASYGSSFVGSLGVKQESKSFEWGLSYRYGANSNQHSNDIMANVAFKF